MPMDADAKMALYYRTVEDFRLSEDKAYSDRARLFLIANTVLLAVVVLTPQSPSAWPACVVSTLGFFTSLLGYTTFARLSTSQECLRRTLIRLEKCIWRGDDWWTDCASANCQAGALEEGNTALRGPFTDWHAAMKRQRRVPGLATRWLFFGVPMFMFALLWVSVFVLSCAGLLNSCLPPR